MYHEQTAQVVARRRKRWIAAAVAVCAVAVALWLAWSSVSAGLREQGAASVRNAILDSAKQCCAIEGSYPSSLAYLEDEYGLSINHDDYIITYEAFAGNVVPSVMVVPR